MFFYGKFYTLRELACQNHNKAATKPFVAPIFANKSDGQVIFQLQTVE
jgi:hypothetical protein